MKVLAALAYGKTFAVPKGKNAVWRNRELFAQVFGYTMPETQVFGLSVPESGRLKKCAIPLLCCFACNQSRQ